MALIFSISSAELPDSTGLTITDTTGAYSISNVGGWGSPNSEVNDVTECTASITKPDTTTLLPSTDPSMTVDIDVWFGSGGNLPNSVEASQTILATDLGYSETLQNGIYKIEVSGYISDVTPFSDTYYLLVYNSLVCCITKQYLSIDLDCDCTCDDPEVMNRLRGIDRLNGAYYNWLYAEGDYSKAAACLIAAQHLCDNCSPCATC